MIAALAALLVSAPTLAAVPRSAPRLPLRAASFAGAPRATALAAFMPLSSVRTPALFTAALPATHNAPIPGPLAAAPGAPQDAAAAQSPASAEALGAATPAATVDAAAGADGASAPRPVDETVEAAASAAAARFDGSLPSPPSPAVAAPALLIPADAHPGWTIRAAKDEDAEWLAGVIAALRESKTGRALLKQVDALAGARGRPVLVDVARLTNNAEVRYDSGMLVMDKNHRRKPARFAAPIMAHELQHVVQKMLDFIPVDSLEMEIESYTIESRVWNELGVKPPANSFARKAKSRLERDPDAFIVWIGEQYKKNRMLHGSSLDAYLEWLAGEKAKNLKKIAAAEKRIRTVERVLARMREAGTPDAQIEAHRHDDLMPAKKNLRDYLLTQAWIERDERLLSSEEGRKRFRDYSRGVIRRARAVGQKTQA